MSNSAHIAAYRAVWKLRHGDGVFTPYDLTDEQTKGRYGTVMEFAQFTMENEVRAAIEAYLSELDKIRCREAASWPTVDMQQENHNLGKRIAELEVALKPFAAFDLPRDYEDIGDAVIYRGNETVLLMGDFRMARAVAEGK